MAAKDPEAQVRKEYRLAVRDLCAEHIWPSIELWAATRNQIDLARMLGVSQPTISKQTLTLETLLIAMTCFKKEFGDLPKELPSLRERAIAGLTRAAEYVYKTQLGQKKATLSRETLFLLRAIVDTERYLEIVISLAGAKLSGYDRARLEDERNALRATVIERAANSLGSPLTEECKSEIDVLERSPWFVAFRRVLLAVPIEQRWLT